MTDHPHAYGDKMQADGTQADFLGSSPRVWGQGSRRYSVAFRFGIIPTRMGTSSASCPIVSIFGDHPHAYGDKIAEF